MRIKEVGSIFFFFACVTAFENSYLSRSRLILQQKKTSYCSPIASSEWKSDFDDFSDSDDDDDALLFSELFETQTKKVENKDISFSELIETQTKKVENKDISGCRARRFILGEDLILSDFAGSLGFDEVTDWEYYYEGDDGEDRKVVQPNPMSSDQPKRTRQSSGSVVRIFRGEFVGRLGGTLGARGLDRRVLIKEFSGKLALDLAEAELISIGRLQSDMVEGVSDRAKTGTWLKTASSRSVNSNQDDQNVCRLKNELLNSPFLGILGEVNLAELEDEWDFNEFYRAMSVKPPKPGAIWIVYEYAGLTSLQAYCQSPEVRRSKIPPKRGFFGLVAPPLLPDWTKRAAYVKEIMRQSLSSLKFIHEAGISHRSIGRSSLLITSVDQDKAAASSIYATNPSKLVMKLADFGFSGPTEIADYDEDFRKRARVYGLSIQEGAAGEDALNFSQAEDLNALGVVFITLLLTTLSEIGDKNPQSTQPATDEDSIQRLLTDIFDKDMLQFRDYVAAEEMWDNVVDYLDINRGWELLDELCFAREHVKEGNMKTAEDLLNTGFFDS